MLRKKTSSQSDYVDAHADSVREHPFNLNGFFWGTFFCLQIWLKNKFLSLKSAEKNIMLALCALKNIVFVENKECQLSRKKVLLRCEAKTKYFDSEHRPPPPLS